MFSTNVNLSPLCSNGCDDAGVATVNSNAGVAAVNSDAGVAAVNSDSESESESVQRQHLALGLLVFLVGYFGCIVHYHQV